MFENMTELEIGLLKAIASDLLNIFFIVGGYKLAKRAKKKQDIFLANRGHVNPTYGDAFIWIVTLVIGLIVAWFFPVKFHEMYCSITGFSYRIGLFAKATQVILVAQMLYTVFRAPTVILPIGRVVIMAVLPVCLIYGHYFQ